MSKDINPTGMYAVVEVVTPERAIALLDSQPPNRNLRPRRIENYCRERCANNWALTHQGIAIDIHGRLRDGQHRLEMVRRTGLPTVFLVVYNVPDEAIIHTDEQSPRSTRDALRIANEGDFSASAIAVANVFTVLPEIPSTMSTTRQECLAILCRHRDAIGFADALNGVIGQTRAPRAVVARAYYHVPRERLEEWVRIMVDGMPVSSNREDDSAAVAYRNYLMRDAGKGGSSLEVDRYRKGQSALHAFARRVPQSKCVGTDRDLFPLPQEPESAESPAA